MKSVFSLPPRRETTLVLGISTVFILLNAYFIGFRIEHIVLMSVFYILFFPSNKSRKLAVALLPFAVYGISYDWMRLYPNYMVNPIDVENLYNLEKHLFGIHLDGMILTPCEYFAQHTSAVADFLSGIFYLGWVPIPMLFGVYLYLLKDRNIYLRFVIAFLLVNWIGFAGYYLHPAAPPWYVMDYGFEPILNTQGSAAGLIRFDELVGIPIFSNLYERNSNVFAALPSLHSAYLVIAFYYALKKKCHPAITVTIGIFMAGIWFTAVYSCHHYIIDVLSGTLCALIGIGFFEYVLMKLPHFKAFFNRYFDYIK